MFRQVGDGVGLDVFDASGMYQGEVIVPPDFGRMWVQHADPDHLYAVLRDQLDVQYVVRLRIERPAR